MPRKSKDWELNEERWERLMRHLGPDPETAGARYNRLLAKIREYARQNTRWDSDEVAELVMNRLAGKLEEEDVKPSHIERYTYMIARFVVQEKRRRFAQIIGEFLPEWVRRWWTNSPGVDKECVEWALAQLPDHQRTLLAEYYPSQVPECGLAEYRSLLAEQLEISSVAVRQRVRDATVKAASLYEACRSKKM